MVSKQEEMLVDSDEPTPGKQKFLKNPFWKLKKKKKDRVRFVFFFLEGGAASSEWSLWCTPAGLLVKGHFHPSEHICIQSEGRENMFHTNCLLFYYQG